MKKTWTYILVPALFLLAIMFCLLLAGERDAAAVREGVVRFHVVAESDSAEDQQLKLKVRDGVFSLIRNLFSECTDREEALSTARENQDLLQREAERILRENGSREEVTVEVGSRFFPTKSYGALSFPAGNYQAVSICIGEAKGRNFWCVLYPALCLAPAVAEDDAAEELVAAVGKQETEFLKKSTQKQQMKFFLVEWFEQITEKFIKR